MCGEDKPLWEKASDCVTDHLTNVQDHDFIADFLKVAMLVTGYAALTFCRRTIGILGF